MISSFCKWKCEHILFYTDNLKVNIIFLLFCLLEILINKFHGNVGSVMKNKANKKKITFLK